MRDKVLTYAIAVSIGIHLAILGLVGRTSAARPIDVEDLKLVRVEVADVPENVKVSEPDNIKPTPKPKPPEPEHVSLPPPEKIPVAPPPKPKQGAVKQTSFQKNQRKPPIAEYSPGSTVASNKLPAEPGGDLNLGSPSQRGDINIGTGGQTPVGWVPGNPGGRGIGSGSGEGVGKPEPTQNASAEPAQEPNPPPPPPPPPDVEVKVCAESGMLLGQYCERTEIRSFRPGKEPTSVCTICKPKHISTLADRAEPELISGPKRPKYPPSARDQGIEGSVTVEYTINTEGNVVGVKVTKSSGNSDLDRAAIETVGSRKYKPAVQGGIPRNFRKRETFHFALN